MKTKRTAKEKQECGQERSRTGREIIGRPKDTPLNRQDGRKDGTL